MLRLLKYYSIILLLLCVQALFASVKNDISKSGVGTLKLGELQVTVSENGIVGVSSSGEDIYGPIRYKLLDKNYKNLLPDSENLISKKKIKLEGSSIISEQLLGSKGVKIRCTQSVDLDNSGILTVIYSVEPLVLEVSIKAKQQRIVIEINNKLLKKEFTSIDSSGKKVNFKKFAGSLLNPENYIFRDHHGRKWRLSITSLKGTSKVFVQLYSSYSKFINSSVFNCKAYTLKFRFDMSEFIGAAPKLRQKKTNKNYELIGKALENISISGTNLLTNGSFEFGMNDWKPEWSTAGKNLIWEIVPSVKSSFCIKYSGIKARGVKLTSFPHPRNNKDIFTVSIDLKATKDGQPLMFGICAAPVNGRKRSEYRLWKKVKITKAWNNYSATFKIPKFWTMDNICFMVGPQKPGTPFFLDNARMYPGKAPGIMSPEEKFGIRIETGQTGNIFTKGKTGSIKIAIVNNFVKPRTFKLKIENIDFWRKSRSILDKSFNVSNKKIKTLTIPVDTANRAYLTLKYNLKDEFGNSKTGSLPYCIVTDNSSLDRLPFGINFHMERSFKEQLDTALDILSKMGFGTVRAWWDWAVVEGHRGQFNWKKNDYQVELCKKNKLQIVPILLRMYGPRWTIPDLFQNPPDDLTLWDNYVKKTVSRYKGKVKYWEIWNEPDVSPVLKYKPELYLNVLKRTYKIIKQIDPKAKVIGIGGSFMWFMEALIRTAGLDSLDIVAYHCYYYKYNPEIALIKWIKTLKKIMGKYDNGRKIPLWNTEVGIIDRRGGHIESEENNRRSAALLVRNYVIAFATGTERLYWFSSSLLSFYPHSLFDYQFIPTPGMIAFNAMSEQLAGSKYTGSLKRKDDTGFFCFTFKLRDGASLAVMWFNGFPASKQIKFKDDNKLKILDIMGVPVKSQTGAYSMTSSFPIYVKSTSKENLIAQIKQAEFIVETSSDKALIKTGKSKPAKPSVGPFKPTRDGMIIDWNIFGPFANPGGRGYDRGLDIDYVKAFGGEVNVNLNMDSSCKYTWPADMKHYLENAPAKTLIKSREYHGAAVADYYGSKTYINLVNVLKPAKYVIGYAFCYIDVPKDMKVKIKMGSDDGCKIFLNHKQIWRNKIYRKAKIDNDVISAKLHKGLNTLLIKISQDGGGWGFYLRISDLNDKAVKNIKIWL